MRVGSGLGAHASSFQRARPVGDGHLTRISQKFIRGICEIRGRFLARTGQRAVLVGTIYASMAKITITFHDCTHGTGDRSKDQRIVSRVFFSVSLEGVFRGEYYCDLKRTPGSDGIEVGRPLFYTGPFNQPEFSRHAAAYLRRLLAQPEAGQILEVTFDDEPINVPTTSKFKPTTFW
jgi:hypothetical protein